VLPGALTGKLSDFAGLLVAPVLMAALLRLRGRVGRVAVFACVAGVFAAIKLSRSLADALEALTTYTPLPWRLWCDPTGTRPLDAPATWPGRDAFTLKACPTLAPRDILGLDQGWRDLETASSIADDPPGVTHGNARTATTALRRPR
jgi:hypothetical protein